MTGVGGGSVWPGAPRATTSRTSASSSRPTTSGSPCWAHPSITIDGRRVEFLTRNAELAVYLLAIAGSTGVPTCELATTFWPGVDERRTGPRLRTLLWQVRNALGRRGLARSATPRAGCFLDLTGVAVDLHEADLARQEAAAARRIAEKADSDRQVRAAAPDGGSGGDGIAVTTYCLLEGWDVDLPPSFDEQPIAGVLARIV